MILTAIIRKALLELAFLYDVWLKLTLPLRMDEYLDFVVTAKQPAFLLLSLAEVDSSFKDG